MYAHRIKILDRADNDAVVVFITHHLHLVFFPAEHRDFDQNFTGRGKVQSASNNIFEFLAVIGDPATAATHCKRRPNDDRETDLGLTLPGLFKAMRNKGLGGLQSNLGHCLAKLFAIFGHVDRFTRGADHLHIVLLQHALAHQVKRTIERGLTAHGRQ